MKRHYILLLTLAAFLLNSLSPLLVSTPYDLTPAQKTTEVSDFTQLVPICTAYGIQYINLADGETPPPAKPKCPLCLVSTFQLAAHVTADSTSLVPTPSRLLAALTYRHSTPGTQQRHQPGSPRAPPLSA